MVKIDLFLQNRGNTSLFLKLQDIDESIFNDTVYSVAHQDVIIHFKKDYPFRFNRREKDGKLIFLIPSVSYHKENGTERRLEGVSNIIFKDMQEISEMKNKIVKTLQNIFQKEEIEYSIEQIESLEEKASFKSKEKILEQNLYLNINKKISNRERLFYLYINNKFQFSTKDSNNFFLKNLTWLGFSEIKEIELGHYQLN